MVKKKKYSEDNFPGYLPNGDLPPGWEFPPDIDDSTITASKIAQATLEGDDFIPQNEAEQELKEEIAEIEAEGGTVEIPND